MDGDIKGYKNRAVAVNWTVLARLPQNKPTRENTSTKCRGAIKSGKDCAIKSGKLLSNVGMTLERGWITEKIAALKRRIGLCGDAT